MKYLIINPRLRNMIMIQIDYLDFEGLDRCKKQMNDVFITAEDLNRLDGDSLIYSILQIGKKKYFDVLNELLIFYGYDIFKKCN
jgi:hypothetical protein